MRERNFVTPLNVTSNSSMKLSLLLPASAIVFAAAGDPGTFDLRPNDASKIELRVYKTGFMKGKVHEFQLTRYNGSVHFDPQTPANSKVHIAIESASIELKDTWLSKKDFQHVQEYTRKDMLASDKFPTISFDSTSVHSNANGSYDVEGTLSIRGIAKAATLSVRVDNGSPQKFTGTSQVRLTSYGIKPPTAGLGTVGTKDEMDLTFTIALP
jgi:polyisoprenoid-binding protein YceI